MNHVDYIGKDDNHRALDYPNDLVNIRHISSRQYFPDNIDTDQSDGHNILQWLYLRLDRNHMVHKNLQGGVDYHNSH